MKYRAEIDGLRAVAVLPVLLFHSGVAVFSGGYVGVDIFFVISGYLITTILIDAFEEERFSLAQFLERRARRILPVLIFVSLACIPPALLLFYQTELDSFGNSLIAVATFSSNLLFAQESGYFANEAELKPLLHTWSLAVEEQFYLIFPLFLLVTWRFGKRVVLGLVGLSFIVSLGVAHWGALKDPAEFFYQPYTRSFELSIGCFAAFILRYRPLETELRLADALAALGLVAIIFSIFIFDGETPFPSLYALVPTLGTFLIILFSRSGTVVHKLLSARVLVSIGLLSYSLYLVHQPIISFGRRIIGNWDSDYSAALFIVLSFLIALPLNHFIEKPMRYAQFSRKRVFLFAFLGLATLATSGLAMKIVANKNRENDPTNYASHWKGWTACDFVGTKQAADSTCLILYPEREPTLALIGDSHAGHLAAGVRYLFSDGSENPVLLVSAGCYPIIDPLAGSQKTGFLSCVDDFITRAFDHVIGSASIKKVWLSGYGAIKLFSDRLHKQKKRAKDFLPKRKEMLGTAIENSVLKLVEQRKVVTLLGDVPELLDSPAACFNLIFGQSAGCPLKAPTQSVKKRQAFFDGLHSTLALKFDGVRALDLKPAFCDETSCVSGTSSENWYQTKDHLTPAGAIHVFSFFRDRLIEN